MHHSAVYKTPCRVFYVTEVRCAFHTFCGVFRQKRAATNYYKLGGSIISTHEPSPLGMAKLHYVHFHCGGLRYCYYSVANKASCRVMSYMRLQHKLYISNL